MSNNTQSLIADYDKDNANLRQERDEALDELNLLRENLANETIGRTELRQERDEALHKLNHLRKSFASKDELRAITESRDYWYKGFCDMRKDYNDERSARTTLQHKLDTERLAREALQLKLDRNTVVIRTPLLDHSDTLAELESAHDKIGDLEERARILNHNYLDVRKMYEEEKAACIKWHNRATTLETSTANAWRDNELTIRMLQDANNEIKNLTKHKEEYARQAEQGFDKDELISKHNEQLVKDKTELDRQLHNAWRSNERLMEDATNLGIDLSSMTKERDEHQAKVAYEKGKTRYWKRLFNNQIDRLLKRNTLIAQQQDCIDAQREIMDAEKAKKDELSRDLSTANAIKTSCQNLLNTSMAQQKSIRKRIAELEKFVDPANTLINNLKGRIDDAFGEASNEQQPITEECYLTARSNRMMALNQMLRVIEDFRRTGVDIV